MIEKNEEFEKVRQKWIKVSSLKKIKEFEKVGKNGKRKSERIRIRVMK